MTVQTGASEARRYELLGPVRAWRAHREVDLGSGKQAAC
jgi:hypothetical protein